MIVEDESSGDSGLDQFLLSTASHKRDSSLSDISGPISRFKPIDISDNESDYSIGFVNEHASLPLEEVSSCDYITCKF